MNIGIMLNYIKNERKFPLLYEPLYNYRCRFMAGCGRNFPMVCLSCENTAECLRTVSRLRCGHPLRRVWLCMIDRVSESLDDSETNGHDCRKESRRRPGRELVGVLRRKFPAFVLAGRFATTVWPADLRAEKQRVE